jgi:hypothetical protein
MNGANLRLLRACVLALLALTAVPAAHAAGIHSVAAGVYGVYGIPVIQQDVGAGPLFGGKVRATVLGPLGLEASFTSFQEGDVTFTVNDRAQKIAGGTQTAMVLDATLGGPGSGGFGIYLAGGIGSYKLTKDYRADLTKTGYNGGVGMEFRSSGPIGVDISARLHAVPLDGGGSRKFGALQAGINYYFIP